MIIMPSRSLGNSKYFYICIRQVCVHGAAIITLVQATMKCSRKNLQFSADTRYETDDCAPRTQQIATLLFSPVIELDVGLTGTYSARSPRIPIFIGVHTRGSLPSLCPTKVSQFQHPPPADVTAVGQYLYDQITFFLSYIKSRNRGKSNP